MRLFIRNINFEIDEKALRDHFSDYGATRARIMLDRTTNRSRGLGKVDIPDEGEARRAIRELDGKPLMGRPIVVVIDQFDPAAGGAGQGGRDRPQGRPDPGAPNGQNPGANPGATISAGGPENFPYRFRERRPAVEVDLKQTPDALHDKLSPGRCDIAFEIGWKPLTPTASNPCIDPDATATMPENDDNELTGYNRRWITIGDRMVISPFTVKSAIANGVANLIGGCYRVIDKIEGHPEGEIKEGQYYYKGGYKRYRVDMARSKPGIIESITVMDNGDRDVTVRPVVEYYLDQEPEKGTKLVQDRSYWVRAKTMSHKRFITGFRPADGHHGGKGEEEVIYYGPYRFGMDLGLKAPDLRKNHLHRFYRKTEKTLTGTLPAVNFQSGHKLKQTLYMGRLKHVKQPDPRDEGGIWHEDLSTLGPGDWVYYQDYFDPRRGVQVISHIGKNYQFKALFYHPDTVPPGHAACDSMETLCPRCRLFGMVNAQKNAGEREAVGFKGRFKASALVCAEPLTAGEDETLSINGVMNGVRLKTWVSAKDGRKLAYQTLLPISGPPKPNKRDVGGYFHPDTGEIRGAKVYQHGKLESARNIQGVNALSPKTEDEEGPGYAHRIRNYAMVCEPNIVEFTGTVGAENANPREIAALVLILSSRMSGHGFKIGLGKAFGMGSVKSAIQRIWVKKPESYDRWEQVSTTELTPDQLKDALDQYMPGVAKEIDALTAIGDFKERINTLANRNTRELKYPLPTKNDNPGRKKYWDIFQQSMAS